MPIQCCRQSPKTREAKEKEQEEREKALRKNRGERENKIPWAAYHGHGRHDITVDQITQHISINLTGGRCF